MYRDLDKPIHYASRGMTKGEKNKSTIEKELAAIHWAIVYFKPYVYGTHFILKTDHRPLVYLFSLRDPTSKLNRMRLELEEYDFEIQYIPGKHNVVADALSRISMNDLKEKYGNVLAVTTRLQRRIHDIQTHENHPSKETSLVEGTGPLKFLEVSDFAARRYPEIMTNPGAGNVVVGYYLRSKKPKILFQFEVDQLLNEKGKELGAALKLALTKLYEKANDINIKNLKIRKQDYLYKLIENEKLYDMVNEVLKTMMIYIVRAPMEIQDKKEQMRLIEFFHENPLYGGHNGYSRLLKKLRGGD